MVQATLFPAPAKQCKDCSLQRTWGGHGVWKENEALLFLALDLRDFISVICLILCGTGSRKLISVGNHFSEHCRAFWQFLWPHVHVCHSEEQQCRHKATMKQNWALFCLGYNCVCVCNFHWHSFLNCCDLGFSMYMWCVHAAIPNTLLESEWALLSFETAKRAHTCMFICVCVLVLNLQYIGFKGDRGTGRKEIHSCDRVLRKKWRRTPSLLKRICSLRTGNRLVDSNLQKGIQFINAIKSDGEWPRTVEKLSVGSKTELGDKRILKWKEEWVYLPQ